MVEKIIEEGESVRIICDGDISTSERNAIVVQKMSSFYVENKNRPEVLDELDNFFAEHTLSAEPNSRELPRIPFAEMCDNHDYMPRFNHSHIAALAKYPEMMKALEELPATPARMQTAEDISNENIRRAVNEAWARLPYNGRRCSSISGVFDAWERNARKYKPSCLSQALQALDKEVSGDSQNYQTN